MTLHDWITQMTPVKVSELLEVDDNTVYQWLKFEYVPKHLHMRKIVKLTKGLVTYEEIIEPYFQHRENQP